VLYFLSLFVFSCLFLSVFLPVCVTFCLSHCFYLSLCFCHYCNCYFQVSASVFISLNPLHTLLSVSLYVHYNFYGSFCFYFRPFIYLSILTLLGKAITKTSDTNFSTKKFFFERSNINLKILLLVMFFLETGANDLR
jgi:hypothetical protein